MPTRPAVLAVIAVACLGLPVAGSGGSAAFRILTHADVGFTAQSIACSASDYSPPGSLAVHCFVVKNLLGYDGITGAAWSTAGHKNHNFFCAATSSATPGFVTFGVSFDTDGDGLTDVDYPQGRWYPLDLVLPGGVVMPHTGVDDVDDLVAGERLDPGAYRGSIVDAAVSGSFSGAVFGKIPGNTAIIFNNFGEDVTIECLF